MKKSHVFAVVVIAISIGLIIVTVEDASTYVNFDQAYKIASAGNAKNIHIVGELKKDSIGSVVGIKNEVNKISFSFLLLDDAGKEERVFYNEPMPPDLKRSEKIVVVGCYQGNRFIADKILLKCPSKYEEKKIQTIKQGY